MSGWQDGNEGSDLQQKSSQIGNADERPKKRIRRTANEINRRFICACGKAYGSEGSLNQHKKNKGHFKEVSYLEGEEDHQKGLLPDSGLYDAAMTFPSHQSKDD